jgi:small subunit ribosomal protein S8
MSTDNYRSFLASINRASRQKQQSTVVFNTKLICSSLLLLLDLGYINSFTFLNSFNIQVFLKYDEFSSPVIRILKAVSRPGKRIFVRCKYLSSIVRNFGLNNSFQNIIISTPFGLMTHQRALKKNVGGEVLFIVN